MIDLRKTDCFSAQLVKLIPEMNGLLTATARHSTACRDWDVKV